MRFAVFLAASVLLTARGLAEDSAEDKLRHLAQQEAEHSSTGQDVSLSKRWSGFDSRMLHRGYGVAATLLRVRQPRRVRVSLATLGL